MGFASYISSKENFAAYFESRCLEPVTEYQLSGKASQKVISLFGVAFIDLFASRANAKCKQHNSWKIDPGSVLVDTFTVDWSLYFFHALSLFSLILKILGKIKGSF